jgi:2-succinyl-5-enolpyruvyl-6-hydroxy-3-cyclohexene-1-carboxylate synthase
MSFENHNYNVAGSFVDELVRCGLRHVCICPGSRSTPLTISFGRHPGISTSVHQDERSASFFALGMARATGIPVALVCTSGTAAAEFHPAVIESSCARVPLLVLTADRPPELHQWGANQTIEQATIYGPHAKWAVHMPVPERTPTLMSFVRATACRAFATAASTPMGTVHINFPFREPLEPLLVSDGIVEGDQTGQVPLEGRPSGRPFINVSTPLKIPNRNDISRLVSELTKVHKGLIVCGPQTAPDFPEVVVTLAGKLGYPVLADPLSGVRCGSHDLSLVIDNYDVFLRDPQVVSTLAPDLVIRFGAVPTSKALSQFLDIHRTEQHILVDDEDGWGDPQHILSEVMRADPNQVCLDLISRLVDRDDQQEWVKRWRNVSNVARTSIDQEMGTIEELFEGKLFHELGELLHDKATLFAGNSMPVRDMDSFFPSLEKRVRMMANRGASGIDGVTSTALGVAKAIGERVVLVTGDLSFYHDMNGLLAAKSYHINATIIVVNNNGGGIFSFLPQAAYPDFFESYFGTPHNLTFNSLADMYGLRYSKIEDWEQFRNAVSSSLNGSGTHIIEVSGDRASNVALHRRVISAVVAALQTREEF